MKKKFVRGKKLLAWLLAASMGFGMPETAPKAAPAADRQALELVYFADCGDFNPETAPEGEKLGAAQSVTDRIYGEDKNGKSWGVVTTETDQAIGIPGATQQGSKAAYTTYQWANEWQTGDLPKEDSFRYARGQTETGINPRYIKYRFGVEPGEYQVTVGMGNTWGNAGKPDIYAGTAGEAEQDVKLNKEALNIPQNGHEEAVGRVQAGEGADSLYVYALSADPTIQMNYIRIEKIPENAVKSLTIKTQPTKTEYVVGEELSVDGLALEAVYSDGTTKLVDVKDCTLTGFDGKRAGEQTVTVSYTEGVTIQASFTVNVKKKPITVSTDPNLVYFVDCGDFDPETTSGDDAVGPYQSVTDRIYGADKNGKSWGVVTTDTDQAIGIPGAAQPGSNAAYTTYQWAHERQTEDLAKEESFRYAREQAPNITPRYVKYRFDVEPGEYQVTVGMGNTWGNAGNPDIYAGTSGEKGSDIKLNKEALNIPENGHEEAIGNVSAGEGTDSLYVYALSNDLSIQMNYIRIVKVPENAVERLTIKTQPTKTEYVVGEELSVDGLTLEAVYKNGTTTSVAVSDCTLTGFDSSQLGEQEVTVSYTEGVTVQASFTVVVKKKPVTVSDDPNLVYFADCGDFDPETASGDDAVGPYQSVTDRIYGADKNGKSWGVVTTETDQAIEIPVEAQPGSTAAYTTYQWAHERQTGDLPKEESFRYAHEQAPDITPRYIKYRFDVEPGEYLVTAGMGNTWGNAENPDIYAGTAGEAEQDVKLNEEALNIPKGGHREATGSVSAGDGAGSLYVYALSDDLSIQMNYIRIEKMPENVLTTLRITAEPEKKEYYIGEELDVTGLALEAVYKDGATKSVAVSDCKLTGFDSSRSGTKTITVTYREVVTVQTSFTVEVKKNPIATSEDPDLVYFVDCGDYDPNTTSDGDTVGKNQSVTDQIYGPDASGRKWGVVTDDGDTAIPMPDAAKEKGSNAAYTEYQWANESQTEDLPKEKSFRYAHGQAEAGISPRYVKYRFEVEPGRYLVTAGIGNSWGNSGNPDVYAGMTGDSRKDVKLNTEPLAVPSGEHRVIQGKAAVAEGKNTLEVYALSVEDTIQLNYIKIEKAPEAEGAVLKRLSVVPPKKLIYQLNEAQELDLEGMSALAVYSDGYGRLIPAESCEFTGFDCSKPGEQTVTVTYTEGDVTVKAVFEIIVVSGKIAAGLEVVPPKKLIYRLNEAQEPDLEGMSVNAVYSDGSKKELSVEDLQITGFSCLAIGRQTVTVSYTEGDITVQDVFEITVTGGETNPVLQSLEVTPPVKTEYQLNEAFDAEGLSVDALYSDGSRKTLQPGDYTVTGFSGDVLGTQTITVSYTEGAVTLEETFQVTVADGNNDQKPDVLTPASLKVTPPARTEYQAGEKLDLNGIQIKVCYSNGEWKTVEPGKCNITGFDSSREGTRKITVSYSEKGITVTDSFSVKIVKKQAAVKNCTVTYHENQGGKVSGMPSDKRTYQAGEAAVITGTPDSSAKFFAGWNTKPDGSGKSYTAGTKITVQEDIHLYAQWKDSYTASNKLNYKVSGRKTVLCSGTANKKASSIKIPATIKYAGITYKVTSIGSNAFAKNKKIQKVTIGNNVKTIKARAFQNCKNLKRVTIGTGLATIEKYAFSGEKKGCVLIINSKRLKTVKTAINHKTKNMTVRVPKSKLKAYRKLFAKKAKKVKVTAK
ncbi:MAG: leucine-rich repeat protein [Lachnospiraceae bacterium]|nr:leucine-rich repeat protein [Lachnospiraceae bacterium]